MRLSVPRIASGIVEWRHTPENNNLKANVKSMTRGMESLMSMLMLMRWIYLIGVDLRLLALLPEKREPES